MKYKVFTHAIGTMKTKVHKVKLHLIIIFALLILYGKAFSQADGTLDTSFNIGTGFNNAVVTIAVFPSGVLAGGWFTVYNGQNQSRIARLYTTGSLDNFFFNIGTGSNDEVSTIVLQPDGKILAGGVFGYYNGQSRNSIARLNTDGTLDTSFNIGTGFSGAGYKVSTIAVQPDGKIIVGGWFTNYNGHARNRIVRLNADGSLDTSFNIGTGFNDAIKEIALQPDGKILATGFFTSYNGQTQNRIARLNTDGTLDASFNSGTAFSSPVSAIAVQPDGKILVGGGFLSYNGQAQNGIVRLNINGSLDNSFTTGLGFDNGSVYTISIQPDGKILAGGSFTLYNGQTRNRIARLNTNGTLDTSFNIGAGFNDIVNDIAIQPDGKILIGGFFTTYNGQTRNRIVRLNNSVLSTEEFAVSNIKIYPNPVKDVLHFSKKIQKITVTDLSGKILYTKNNVNQTDMSEFPSGVYLVVMEQENGSKESQKVIKK
ncbi:T9SS type A sorting domain-containing protein [Flavobacterium lindanitolerans]|uniref:T9SS type A sorting domain-containing protein n=1 Tax=Flavobacterium lindanitolerans TaxID=428988 RepID=UPI002808067F|nr:T9SS type A sorting domain-containing protein [Flavobacterium lindanitolerans]MDQ7960901.1 T9SS type A sorting domain-containing protein [Flavobacterium lindanitolerans]